MATSLNLLLIEDDPHVRDQLVETLIGAGHSVKQANTLRTAKRHLQDATGNKKPFDAILCDFWLQYDGPKTPGSETYKLVRELAGSEVPLLCASSDIVMWERLKEQHEDERMFTCRKKYTTGNGPGIDLWNADWVTTTLATVKDLPPLPVKLPEVLIISNAETFRTATQQALEAAGYAVTTATGVMEAVEHLLPNRRLEPNLVATISDTDLTKGNPNEILIVAFLRKTIRPLLGTGQDLTAWEPARIKAHENNLPLHIVPYDPAQLLTKLKELGL